MKKMLIESHLLNNGYDQTNDEKNRIKVLEAEKRQLEVAMAQAQLNSLILEIMISMAEKHYEIDIKEKFSGKQLQIL